MSHTVGGCTHTDGKPQASLGIQGWHRCQREAQEGPLSSSNAHMPSSGRRSGADTTAIRPPSLRGLSGQDPEQADRHCCAWGQTTMPTVWTEGHTEGSSRLALPSLVTPSARSPAEESINTRR